MRKILGNKKAAFELSMTTVVVIVLSMVMLILGLTLVGNIFGGATDNIDELNDKVRDLINEKITDSKVELAFLISGGTVEIPQGKTWGIAFGFSPVVSGTFSYDTEVAEVSTKCPSWITKKEAEEIIILGKSSSFGEITSGDKRQGLIKIEIPKNYPLGCQIRYLVSISKDGTPYKSRNFDIEVTRSGIGGIF